MGGALIPKIHFAAPRLHIAAVRLGFQAFHLHAARDFSFLARLGRVRGLLHQRDEPRKRVGAVALLGAEAICAQHNFTIEREPAPGQLFEPHAYVIGQGREPAQPEAQLNGGGHLIDVLPARPGGADEALLKVALIKGKVIGHRNHGFTLGLFAFQSFTMPAKNETKPPRPGTSGVSRRGDRAMRFLLAGVLGALALGACAGGAIPGLMMAVEDVNARSPHLLAAIADPRRPEADIERDSLRRPAEILAFAQIRPGDRVADVGPGAGYYTRLLSAAVGPSGRVYAVDRPGTAERPRPAAALVSQYGNITHLESGYQSWSAEAPLDAILVVQIYHDFHLPQLNIDAAAANRTLFNALRPGGVLLIVDHTAPAGVADAPSTLHRIEAGQVRAELEAAGFVLEAESQVLRNPADNLSLRVFEGDVRGRTDQFVLRFRKPAAP